MGNARPRANQIRVVAREDHVPGPGLQQASAEESTYDPSPSRGGSAFRIQRSCFSGFGVVHSGSGKQLYQNLPVGCER